MAVGVVEVEGVVVVVGGTGGGVGGSGGGEGGGGHNLCTESHALAASQRGSSGMTGG